MGQAPQSNQSHLSTLPSEKYPVEEPDQAYRILVENEDDVLPLVCTLIEKHRKVVCYMSCNITSFGLYQKLINNVTEAPVYVITEITAAELEQVGNHFLEGQGGTLLLPETVRPDMKLGETDSWVIHIGWPADKHQYEAQMKAHQAQNNILVACSKDENLYPAGAAIMSRAQPWPGNDVSFGISVDVLRPLFDERLAAIPSRLKETVYTDWIASHGPNGHRHVRSWTSSDLVYHANSYLLDVLQYHDPNSRGTDSRMQASLFEVSATFVADNELESAVKEGVLRVQPSSSLNHISSLSQHDFVPPSPTPLDETGPTEASNYQASVTASDYAPSYNPDIGASSSYHPAESLRSPTPAPGSPDWDTAAESST